MTREFTGKHMLILMVTGFGIIISVNLLLAFKAVSTFPGIVVANSYVASQNFDEVRAAQEALGWTVSAEMTTDTLTLRITDAEGAVAPQITAANLGRPTHTAADVTPEFTYADGVFTAPIEVGDGDWVLRIEMQAADGTIFRRRIPIEVGS